MQSGPPGQVVGTIHVSGDPPPVIESIAPEIPVGKCFAAHETYSKLFREGPGRTLADVLVAVTGYSGKPEFPTSDVIVEANDCSYDRRTVVLYRGQTLGVKSVGNETYGPQLVGHQAQAILFAVPGGEPIKFTPNKLGQYQLVDRSHPHIFTDVFVLSYPTFDVTGKDGAFAISGIPPGPAKLSALLPITGQSLEKDIVVPAGGTVRVDLQFTFDDEQHGEKARAKRGSK